MALYLVLWEISPKKEIGDNFIEHAFLFLNVLDFHNKVTTSETLISDYKVRSQVHNNVKSRLIMVYYLY